VIVAAPRTVLGASRTLREVLCRRHLYEAVLCERWKIAGLPASAYGGRR
jgi:hypothetical protein